MRPHIPTFSRVVALALLLVVATSVAADSRSNADEDIARIYAPFAELLDRFAIEKELPDGGLVSAFDYAAALQYPGTKALLEEQSERLADFDRTTLRRREAAIAFWLNAYNYFMIRVILDNPRDGQLVSSVRDYGSLFDPYRIFGQQLFDVGGRAVSLDEIEKGILLGDEYREKGWMDARVHFAVNCASVGCPPLRAEIYLPDSLEHVLTENTRRALSTPRHFRPDGNVLFLSRIFDWYEHDFVVEEGSVKAFIKAYGARGTRKAVEAAQRVRYIDYDWSLNRPGNFPELDG